MSLFRINSTHSGLQLHGSQSCWKTAIERHSSFLEPAIIMIHGYKFHPNSKRNCPHIHILSPCPSEFRKHTISWPQALGWGELPHRSFIAFGWPSRGRVQEAYKRARDASHHLAQLIRHLKETVPNRPVHIIAHSFGSRVALNSMSLLKKGDVDRVVLLSPAEYDSKIKAALDNPAARLTQFLSVESSENWFFDRLFEYMIPANGSQDRAMGFSRLDHPALARLFIDDFETLAKLAKMGVEIESKSQFMSHWSTYMRQGVFDLYKRFLTQNEPELFYKLQQLPTFSTSQSQSLIAPLNPLKWINPASS